MSSVIERPLHVLLVDDDEDEFVVIRDVLSESKDQKYKLQWVADASSALQTLKEQPFDICLVDYRLGADTGVELIKEAAKSGIRIPMILLTGYADKETSREAIRLGAADYLSKSEISSYLLDRAILYAIHRTQMRAQAVSQDRMASIGMLASSLAHEIGTPLGVIRGRAEYLGMQVGKDEAIRKNVDVILSQIDRVSHLIRSLLNVARGDSSDQLTAVSVSKVVKDVLDLVDHEVRKAGVNIKNEVTSSDIRIDGEPQKLHQVLLNLVVNALYALQKSERLDKQLHIFVEDHGPQWRLVVEDTGSGISKDNLPNLFRPFFTTKADGVGTGLGLATSLWIVQSWGGSIDIESELGKGTAVSLCLSKAT